MKTTALFVEILIEGLLTLLLILLIVSIFIGDDWWSKLASVVINANLLVTAVLLALAYVVGAIADECYENISLYIEEKIVNKKLKKENITVDWNLHARVILMGSEAVAALEYMRSRVRILRAAILVIPVSTVAGVVLIFLHWSLPCIGTFGSVLLVFILGAVLSAASFFAFVSLDINYWRRVHVISKQHRS